MVDWWETIFKAGIKKITQDYCRKRANRIRDTKLFFQICLKDLAPLIGNSEERWHEFQGIQLEARIWEAVGLQGANIRSKQNQPADTEDPSIFHMATEIKRARQTKIDRLKVIDENYVSTADSIDKALTDHFRRFFFPKQTKGKTNLKIIFLPEITDKTATGPSIVGTPLLIEVTTVLKEMSTNKTPGDDGIPYEFYSSFWKTKGPIF